MAATDQSKLENLGTLARLLGLLSGAAVYADFGRPTAAVAAGVFVWAAACVLFGWLHVKAA